MRLDPVVQEYLVLSLSRATAPADAPPGAGATGTGTGASVPDGLTPRETEVLRLIAERLPNAGICDRLHISQAAIKTHLNRICTRTGARDRSQAVRYAFRHGLAQPG
ncbi:LuxR C-terminal-related transcriptional regulator [Kitasatospora sp. NPDC002227]|uniref:response regulator transcription factor n=1 Tax=Kitasatospora sp. NPDC002227 TaxID=3154773 RepID=UPI00332DDECB